MTEAPKEIWLSPRNYRWWTSPCEDLPLLQRYIHEDESKAREEAAYKRGRQEALKGLLKDIETRITSIRSNDVYPAYGLNSQVAALEATGDTIRAKIQERGDAL